MAYVLPKTQIYVKELDSFYDAVVSESNPTVMTCSVEFPANTETTAKEYTLEVYADDVATGVATKVTVAAAEEPAVKYQVSNVSAEPSELGAEGGTSTVTINLTVPAE